MTYWALNAIFLGIVALIVIAGMLAHRTPSWRAVAITLAVVLPMTAVFDNVMISVGLVAYNPAAISGVFIGVAPLEDFAYAIAAAVGLPSLWALLGPSRTSGRGRSLRHSKRAGPSRTQGTADA